MKCNYCGQAPVKVINENCTGACERCASLFGTCSMCLNGVNCEFETNPSPMPKQVMQTIRQGNMVMQTVVPNPERIKAFCTNCSCYGIDPPMCLRQFGTCGQYNEYIPSPTPVEENTPVEEIK